jgi:hypothetical protein
MQLQIRSIKKKQTVFFSGKNAMDLESVLYEEIKRLKKAEGNIDLIFETLTANKILIEKSIKKVGVVRFNPFKSSGGDQSFSIALLDSQDNGLVVSGLYTQEGTRVYTKPIKNLKSDYPLSKEELKALDKANLKPQ